MKEPIIRQSPLTGHWYFARSYVQEGKLIRITGKKLDVTEQIEAIIAEVLKQEAEKK